MATETVDAEQLDKATDEFFALVGANARLRRELQETQAKLEKAHDGLEDIRAMVDGTPSPNLAMRIHSKVEAVLETRPREDDGCEYCGGPFRGAGSHATCHRRQLESEEG